MAAMTLNVDVEATLNYGVSITGDSIQVWDGEGLPCFEGELGTASKLYPSLFRELLKRKILISN